MKIIKIIGILIIGGFLFNGICGNVVFAENNNGVKSLIEDITTKINNIEEKLNIAFTSIDNLKNNDSSQTIAELEGKVSSLQTKVVNLEGKLEKSDKQLTSIKKALRIDDESVQQFLSGIKPDIARQMDEWEINAEQCAPYPYDPGNCSILREGYIPINITNQYITISDYITQQELEKMIQAVYDENKHNYQYLNPTGVHFYGIYSGGLPVMDFQYDLKK